MNIVSFLPVFFCIYFLLLHHCEMNLSLYISISIILLDPSLIRVSGILHYLRVGRYLTFKYKSALQYFLTVVFKLQFEVVTLF